MRHFLLVSAAFLGLLGCLEAGGGTTESATRVTSPKFFIADTLGPACTRDNQGKSASQASASSAFNRLQQNGQLYVT